MYLRWGQIRVRLEAVGIIQMFHLHLWRYNMHASDGSTMEVGAEPLGLSLSRPVQNHTCVRLRR